MQYSSPGKSVFKPHWFIASGLPISVPGAADGGMVFVPGVVPGIAPAIGVVIALVGGGAALEPAVAAGVVFPVGTVEGEVVDCVGVFGALTGAVLSPDEPPLSAADSESAHPMLSKTNPKVLREAFTRTQPIATSSSLSKVNSSAY
jgi:hypothetical protein